MFSADLLMNIPRFGYSAAILYFLHKISTYQKTQGRDLSSSPWRHLNANFVKQSLVVLTLVLVDEAHQLLDVVCALYLR